MKEINSVLLYTMACLAFIYLVFESSYLLMIVFVSFLVGLLLMKIMDQMGFKPHHKTIVLIFLWLSIIGEAGIYVRWEAYDKILHLIVPFFITYLVSFYVYKTNLKHKKIFIFFVVMGMAGFFEVFEYLVDSILMMNMGGVRDVYGKLILEEWIDTMWDLIMTIFGSGIYLIFKNGKTINSNHNPK